MENLTSLRPSVAKLSGVGPTKRLLIRVPASLHATLTSLAEQNLASLSRFCTHLFEEALGSDVTSGATFGEVTSDSDLAPGSDVTLYPAELEVTLDSAPRSDVTLPPGVTYNAELDRYDFDGFGFYGGAPACREDLEGYAPDFVERIIPVLKALNLWSIT